MAGNGVLDFHVSSQTKRSREACPHVRRPTACVRGNATCVHPQKIFGASRRITYTIHYFTTTKTTSLLTKNTKTHLQTKTKTDAPPKPWRNNQEQQTDLQQPKQHSQRITPWQRNTNRVFAQVWNHVFRIKKEHPHDNNNKRLIYSNSQRHC